MILKKLLGVIIGIFLAVMLSGAAEFGFKTTAGTTLNAGSDNQYTLPTNTAAQYDCLMYCGNGKTEWSQPNSGCGT